MELALRRLAGAQTADRIFEKDITAIDLREAGRMVVRTRPGALEEYKAQQAAAKGDNI
jgi:cell division protein FtsQ